MHLGFVVVVVFYRTSVYAVWPNYEVVEFQTRLVTALNIGSVAYCYVVIYLYPLPNPPAVRIPSKGESTYFPVRQLCPSCLCTISSTQLGVPRLFPRITLPHRPPLTWASYVSDASAPSSATTLTFPAPCWSLLLPSLPDSCWLWFLASHEIYFNMALNWVSVSVFRHHGALLFPSTAYPVSSCTQTLDMVWRATHGATGAWYLLMYVLIYFSPSAFKTISSPSWRQVPSSRLFAHFPVTCSKKTVCNPAIIFSVASNRIHVSAPASRVCDICSQNHYIINLTCFSKW